MDNLSHVLAGLAIGELIERSLAPEADPHAGRLRRRLLLLTGALGANLPDLDLVLTGLLPAPLGYLLHHRGHTHTIVFALAQALALMLLLWLLWPGARRLLGASRSARIGLCAAALIGLGSHLLLDYLNSYGLHPFYPLDGRWLYGDMVFILEPVFWFAFGLPLVLMVQARWLRLALLALFPLFLAWAWYHAYLHWASAAALAMLLSALLGTRAAMAGRARHPLVAGLALAAVFVGVQGWSSGHGKRVLAAHLQTLDPGSRLLDAALTAFPANPACWTFATVELTGEAGPGAQGEVYRLRRGVLSIAPALLPQAACPAGLNLAVSGGTAAVGMAWQAHTPLARLRARARNCHFAAWLRFARLPHVEQDSAADIRYGNRGENFTSFAFARFAGQPCSSGVPGWSMPREDLLDYASGVPARQ
ncbi:metal-dependent hydrolase [Massilia sp. PAMC28688]|uniref:metal-dependent hydrolase n=1 Tax=Massilia sp. PAMC28688 TaxID=2861283 RepID=UPI001C628CE4|nr:metal-dependent hydrolase [Massilia sp. PAMC28688]QYF92787.1 metal-dependent hydrolase [Massilia sp. PAMC28688]